MLLEEDAHICIGTDSLASNHQLCILSELYTIKQHYPDIDWELLLCWGTLESACALQMQIQTGHISEGLAPGINQILLLDEPGFKPLVKRIF
jgi:cytosine/adenosine deaminase-related metal-dependent hydrolase